MHHAWRLVCKIFESVGASHRKKWREAFFVLLPSLSPAPESVADGLEVGGTVSHTITLHTQLLLPEDPCTQEAQVPKTPLQIQPFGGT